MDLFEFADGSAESPAEDASDEVRRKFNSRAKKAWTYICLAVEPEQQIHVRKQRLRKRLGMPCKGNLRENRYYKR